MNSHMVAATDIQIGDRLDSAGKTRVARLHERNGAILARIQTRGTRSPSLRKWDAGTFVRVWR